MMRDGILHMHVERKKTVQAVTEKCRQIKRHLEQS